MELFVLLLASASLMITIGGMVRPMRPWAVIAGRIVLLIVCASVTQFIFSVTADAGAASMSVMMGLVIGWLATLNHGRIVRKGLDPKVGWVEVITPEVKDVVLASTCALVLALMIAQQSWFSGPFPMRRDGFVLTSWGFALCMGSWTVIISAAMLPWRMHRRWSIPLVVAIVIGAGIHVLAAWLTSGSQWSDVPRQSSRATPLGITMTEIMRMFGTQSSGRGALEFINLFAILASFMMLVRHGMHRMFGADDDRISSPMPGERTV